MKRIGVLSGALVFFGASAWAAPTHYVVQATEALPANFSTMVTKAGGTVQKTFPAGIALATSSNASFAASMAKQGFAGTVTADQAIQWVPSRAAAVKATLSGPSASSLPPVDPTTAFFYACQWNLQQIDAPGAWGKGQFGDGMKIADLDTGTDPFHQDLEGKVDLVESASVLTPGSSPCGAFDEETIFDLSFHGTFVTSMIAANGLGMAGVAPNSSIVAVKVLNCEGSGSFGDIITGIYYAASLPDVQFINMSLGAVFPKKGAGSLIGALNTAVNYATSVGKMVVSAAGNNGIDLQHALNFTAVPCESGQDVCVYATNNQDTLASYTNFGASATWVGAPGGDFPDALDPNADCLFPADLQGLVVGACSEFVSGCDSANDFYTVGDGTSFASPTVVGVAALVDGAHGGTLSPTDMKSILAASADDLGKNGTDNLYSHGRVNASNAVDH